MKLGFTGTREGMTTEQGAAFSRLLAALAPTDFHRGMCRGADLEAHRLVRRMLPSCVIHGHPPINTRLAVTLDCDEYFDPEDYIKRNRSIVTHTDWLVATPLTATEVQLSGTWTTIRFARKVGRVGYIVGPTGAFSNLYLQSVAPLP